MSNFKQLKDTNNMAKLRLGKAYDDVNNTYTITETCCKCGKQFSFTTSAENFGI